MMKWCILILCCSSYTTEIDSFSDRDPALVDSLNALNQLMESYFKFAVDEANKKHSCSGEVIEEALAEKNGNILWSKLEIDIENSVLIDKRRSSTDNSIYGDMDWLDSPVLHLAKLGFMMKVGGFMVGSDKFGHFMQQGYEYFKMLHRDKKSLKEVLEWGDMTERTYLGLLTTGIYSYGDLAANYDGIRFWERVSNDYFSCHEGIWRQNVRFDWLDYVNYAWDEGINCSRYRNTTIDAGVMHRIQNISLKCPIDRSCCSVLAERYKDVSRQVLSPMCM